MNLPQPLRLVALLSALLVTQHASGEDSSRIQGKLLQVDPSLITVELDDDEGAEKSFSLTSVSKATVDGQPARIIDLRPGMHVTCSLSDDEAAVLEVEAAGNTVSGTLESVDPKKRRVSLFLRKQDTVTTLPLHRKGKTLIDGDSAELADFYVEHEVSVLLSVDGKSIVKLHQRTPREVRVKTYSQKFRGAIAGIDRKHRRLTLVRESEDNSRTSTFVVAKDAEITQDGRVLSFDQLQIGQVALARYRGEPPEVFELSVGALPRSKPGRRAGKLELPDQPPRGLQGST